MKLTEYSQNRLMHSLNHWHVPKDFAEPMYNYLVFGIEPGGFLYGWFANDASCIIRSHPANTVQGLKDLMKWMINCPPVEAWGSYDRVKTWMRMEPAQRRPLLEQRGLIYTEQDEIMMALRSAYTEDPIFYA